MSGGNKSMMKEIIMAVWPIWLGYIPLGLACGVLAGAVGVDPLAIGIMALFVFAGSGQFIALAMMGSGAASISSIVLTTFIVNLRHLLYSSTLSPYLKGQSAAYLMGFTQGITDETFAVNISNFEKKSAEWTPPKAIWLNVTAHSCWILSCIVGDILGSIIAIDTELVGYTLTAMFIGLWSFHLVEFKKIAIGLLAGVLALALSTVLDYKLHIVVATVAAATTGLLWEGRRA